jgi:hypothetical protein
MILSAIPLGIGLLTLSLVSGESDPPSLGPLIRKQPENDIGLVFQKRIRCPPSFVICEIEKTLLSWSYLRPSLYRLSTTAFSTAKRSK